MNFWPDPSGCRSLLHRFTAFISYLDLLITFLHVNLKKESTNRLSIRAEWCLCCTVSRPLVPNAADWHWRRRRQQRLPPRAPLSPVPDRIICDPHALFAALWWRPSTATGARPFVHCHGGRTELRRTGSSPQEPSVTLI